MPDQRLHPPVWLRPEIAQLGNDPRAPHLIPDTHLTPSALPQRHRQLLNNHRPRLHVRHPAQGRRADLLAPVEHLTLIDVHVTPQLQQLHQPPVHVHLRHNDRLPVARHPPHQLLHHVDVPPAAQTARLGPWNQHVPHHQRRLNPLAMLQVAFTVNQYRVAVRIIPARLVRARHHVHRNRVGATNPRRLPPHARRLMLAGRHPLHPVRRLPILQHPILRRPNPRNRLLMRQRLRAEHSATTRQERRHVIRRVVLLELVPVALALLLERPPHPRRLRKLHLHPQPRPQVFKIRHLVATQAVPSVDVHARRIAPRVLELIPRREHLHITRLPRAELVNGDPTLPHVIEVAVGTIRRALQNDRRLRLIRNALEQAVQHVVRIGHAVTRQQRRLRHQHEAIRARATR